MKSEPIFYTKNLSPSDYRDIAIELKFQKCRAMNNIITYGEKGDKFYILFKGTASVLIPNPELNGDKRKQLQREL